MQDLNASYPKTATILAKVITLFGNFKKTATSGNLWNSLNTSIKKVSSNMTGLQKGVIGAVAVFGEFTLVKSGFKDLVSGSENIVAALGKITVGAGAASAALYLAFGPAGLVVSAITALGGMIVGINDSIKDMATESMFDTISTVGTVSLDDLGKKAVDTFESIRNETDTTVEKLNSISQTKESLRQTASNIDSMRTAIENGAYTAEEKIPEIIEQFQYLLQESKNVFEEEYEVIVGNMAGAWYDYLVAQGEAVPESIALLSSYRDQANEAYSEIEQSLYSLIDQFNNGEISAEEFNEQAEPLAETLASINKDGSIDKSVKAIENFGSSLDMSKYIKDNSFNVELLKSDINSVVQSAKDGKNNMDSLLLEGEEKIDGLFNLFESLKIDTSDFDWSSLYGANEDQVKDGKQAINDAYEEYANAIQYGALEQLPSIVEDAIEKYEGLDPITKAFTSKEDFVKKEIDAWKTNVMTPLSESINESFTELGISAEPFIEQTATDMVDSLYDTYTVGSYNGMEQTALSIKDNWKESMVGVLEEVKPDICSSATDLAVGTVSSFDSEITNSTGTTTQTVSAWIGAAGSELNNGSLSDTAGQVARNVISKFNSDISGNAYTSVDQMNSYRNSIGNCFAGARGEFENVGKNIVDGLNDGITSKFSSLSKTMSDLAGTVKNTIKNKLDIHSPSRVMKKLGKFTMEGFNGGLLDMFKSVQSTLSEYADMVTQFNADTSMVPNDGAEFAQREISAINISKDVSGRSFDTNVVVNALADSLKPIMEEAFVEAAMAVSGASNSQKEPFIENILKIDSETIYRIVQKGKEKNDRRYHIVTEF